VRKKTIRFYWVHKDQNHMHFEGMKCNLCNRDSFTISFQLSNKLSSRFKRRSDLNPPTKGWLVVVVSVQVGSTCLTPPSHIKHEDKKTNCSTQMKRCSIQRKQELHMQQMSTIVSARTISSWHDGSQQVPQYSATYFHKGTAPEFLEDTH